MVDHLELGPGACRELDDAGFTVVAGPVPLKSLAKLAAAYDAATKSASPEDVSVGSCYHTRKRPRQSRVGVRRAVCASPGSQSLLSRPERTVQTEHYACTNAKA